MDPTPYRVDGEVGRLTFSCHHVRRDGTVLLDTSRAVFPALVGKEWYRTVGFKGIAIVRGALDGSYRHATELLNRIRHQPKATPLRTLQDAVEAEGQSANKALDEEARRVLREEGFDETTLMPISKRSASESTRLTPEVVEAALRAVAPDDQTLAAMQRNPVKYEDPSDAVNVSIDDVLAKKQKEHRDRPRRASAESPASRAPSIEPTSRNLRANTPAGERKRVHTTVAHVEAQAGRRIFASVRAHPRP